MKPGAGLLLVRLLWLWLGLGLVACGDKQPTINVTVSGLPSGAQGLDVSGTLIPAGSDMASSSRLPASSVTSGLGSFVLELPLGTAGSLVLHISAINKLGCQIAQGDSAALAIDGTGPYQATITLNLATGCQLSVNKLGDGDGTVSVSSESSMCGTAAMPFPCSYSYAPNTTVTLTATPTISSQDYFAGWSGACKGTSPCTVTIGQGITTVNANIFPRRVCSFYSPAAADREGFCWEHPLPQGNQLNRLWSFAEDDVWAVGNQGILLHWDGNFWVNYQSGTFANLNGVWGVSNGAQYQVWVAGDNGTLLYYDGQSQGFVSVPTHLAPNLLGVGGDGQGNLWLAGTEGSLYYAAVGLSNGVSVSLSPISCGQPMASLNAVFVALPPHSPTAQFLAVGSGGVIVSGSGKACMLTSTPPANNLYGAWLGYSADGSSYDAWVVGDNGAATPSGVVLHQSGSGAPAGGWATVNVGVQPSLHGVWSSGDGQIWMAGAAGAILAGPGASFNSPNSVDNSNEVRNLRDIRGTSDNDVWSLGEGGALIHGNAAFFTGYTAGTNGTLRAAYQDQSGAAWIVGDAGVILRFTGTTLAQQASPTGSSLEAVWGTGPNDVWAAGPASSVYHYTGKSSTWTTVASSTTSGLTGGWSSSTTEAWAVGGKGTLLHYAIPSKATTPVWAAATNIIPNIATINLTAVSGCSASDVWAVGSGGTILHYDGTQWTAAISGTTATLTAVWPRSPTSVFVVGDAASGMPIVLSFNGTTWAPLTNGISTSPAPSLTGVWGGESSCSAAKASTADASVWAVGTTTDPTGTITIGVLLRYDGTTWSQVQSGTTSTLIGIRGYAGKEFWLVGGEGVALRHVYPGSL